MAVSERPVAPLCILVSAPRDDSARDAPAVLDGPHRGIPQGFKNSLRSPTEEPCQMRLSRDFGSEQKTAGAPQRGRLQTHAFKLWERSRRP
jgi:hypothetical protein